MGKLCSAAALGLGLALTGPKLLAQSVSATGTRLSFVRTEGALGCVTAPALEREIARRMGRDPFEGVARQWIEGVVSRNGNYFEVQLFERDAEGKTLGTRRLRESGDDCHKLDDASVLAIALIIDPTVQLLPASTVAAPPSVESAGPFAQMPPDVPPLATPAQPAPASPSVAIPKLRSQASNGWAPTTRSDTSSKRLAPFASLDAVAVSGVLPGVALGAELVTQLPLSERSPHSLRLSALFLPEKHQQTSVGNLAYGLTAFEVGACTGSYGRHAAWYGCLAMGVGSVHAVVHDPNPLDPGGRVWASIRPEVGTALHIVGPVWVETRLFDLVALTRWQFRVKVNGQPETAFGQSTFMPGAALGIGLHLD